MTGVDGDNPTIRTTKRVAGRGRTATDALDRVEIATGCIEALRDPLTIDRSHGYSCRHSIRMPGDTPMSRTDLMRGTLDLLILRALTTGPDHGLGIARRVEQITQGAFRVNPGSLFPALHRLAQKGWLTAEWGRSETNRKAKYYELTPDGRHQLEAEARNWKRISVAIDLALDTA